MSTDSDSAPIGVQEILREGGRIIAILLFWGILGAFARYGVANIGLARPGNFFFEVGYNLAVLFVLTGLTSILIYAIARGIQLSRH
ncbi:hypothetical protein [Halosolutus halophilus]|uniref:hypothetical protein n=1 Tax=Halosolutus halophilus TaxID=1552990 RepID=UPI0022351DBE|nr:hypothetical protein [Halosolutus halophilus]